MTDADEPMMPGSDEFSDLEDGYLEDTEDCRLVDNFNNPQV